MHRRYIAGVLALGLLFGSAACSSDDDGDSASGNLASQIQDAAKEEGEEVTDEQADCLGQMLVALLGEDGAKDAVAEGSEGIQEAMTALEDGGDDPLGTLEKLQEVDEDCLALMGLDPGELDIEGLLEEE